ncbi:MAG: protein kinase domain-containing protein [Pseudomarimonas sp.]
MSELPPLAQLDACLQALLTLSPPERALRLAHMADHDPAMAHQLQRLLQLMSDSDTQPLRELGIAAVAGFEQAAGAQETATPRIPGYRIEGEIGHGGMGTVFEAARELGGDIWQPVAVKVLRRALHSPEELQRFVAEQRILARLQHPNIAGLLDAGVAGGRPWMALERVAGVAIDRTLRAPAPPSAVLRAMLQVAEALQQAHALLVVHRDIKPGNVLMDAAGRVKLIDFGIAKQLDAALDDSLTGSGGAPLTLRYASPEQLLQRPVGVASDIYQVGLLMYQLLTGSWPWDESIQQLPTLRTHSDDEPPAPSRKFTPGPQRRALVGDIDAIVQRCLQFDPAGRYATAAELKEDIEAHLAHRPVRARRHTRWYLARSFLLRHRLAATVATSVVLLAALSLGAALQNAQRSREHAESLASERNAATAAQTRAETLYDFLLDVIGSGDPENTEQHGRSIDDVLSDAVDRVAEDSTLPPAVAAQLASDLGTVLFHRGSLEAAERSLRTALQRFDAAPTTAATDAIGVSQHLALVLHQLQRSDEAHATALAMVEDVRRLHGPRSALLGYTLKTLAVIESGIGDQVSAEARLREALLIEDALTEADRAAARDLLGAGDAQFDNRTDILKQLGLILLRQQRAEEAEPLLAEGLRMLRELHGSEHPYTLEAMLNHAAALRVLGRLEEARVQLEAVLAGQRRLHDTPNRMIAMTLGTLANVAGSMHKLEQAVSLWEAAEKEAVAAMGETHPWIGSARLAKARALQAAGRSADAVLVLRQLALLEGRSDDLPARAATLLTEIESAANEPAAASTTIRD